MLSNSLIEQLQKYQLDPVYVEDLVVRTIAEDLAGGIDVTSVATIPDDQKSIGEFRVRRAGTVSGLNIAAAVLESQGITEYSLHAAEGDRVIAGQIILVVKGNTRKLLLAERTCLNFLGRLSGISTLTHRWVEDVKGLPVQIRDTRKTTPLHRELEKFAVRMGGGTNHRMSLSDAALIKDNHILAAGGVTKAFEAVRKLFPNIAVEVEVDRLEQLRDVVEAGADLVLLDNMSLEQCRAAVEMVQGRIKLEASGGLTLENARAYASTGVDYLAVGALTHSAAVLDIGLDFKAD
ncbi:MAG: carboxylating nicotinate-nucleotide diphosphorylase [Actinomycetes bacterium]